MRLLRIAASAALIALSASCDSPTISEDGRFTGRLDGRVWNGTALAGASFEGTSFSVLSRSGGEEGAMFTLSVIPLAGGGFQLVPELSAYYDLYDRGRRVSYTAAITDLDLEVDDWPRENGDIITGRASFTIQGSRGSWRFEDGAFVAHLKRGVID